jgi:hypothetical protein
MRFAHLALAAALAFAACEVGASTGREYLPGDLIESCLTELEARSAADGQSDSRNFDLDKNCPELAKKLALSLDAGAVGSVKIDATSIEGMHDLQFFAAGFEPRPTSPENIQLDFDGLDALLADVLIEDTADEGPWDRFLRWLEQYTTDGESPNFKRFVNWLENLDAPPWLADAILKVSLVLIVLLALMVVGNELRLAGVLRRIRRPRHLTEAGGTDEAASRSRAPSLDELGNLPARQLATAVLEIVTAAFAHRGWLSASTSLTNGELIRQLGQQHSSVAGLFTDLVRGIEKVIYGDRLPDDESRQRLVATARELMERARSISTVAPQAPR